MAIVDYIERFYNRQRLDQAWAIAVRRSSLDRRVVRTSRVCCSEAHLSLTLYSTHEMVVDQ